MTTGNGHFLVWISGPTGLAHASKPGRAVTLCGQRTRQDRGLWPESVRCLNCVLLANPAGHVRVVDRDGAIRWH
jgi:hypothetical protein